MRKYIFLLPLFFLFACAGYKPLHQVARSSKAFEQVEVGTVRMAKVAFNVGERRVAQIVAHRLRQTFEGSGAAATLLHMDITETESAIAVRRDAVEQRLQLTLVGELRLVENGLDVFNSTVSVSSVYNVEDSPFGTEAGRDRARQSAARLLAEEAIFRALQHFASRNRSPQEES